ncbi:TadE/TadG family type IV pilus assembly protein [uncultured Gimesia sp.]|uniref:TadE/TadG family type IV pilus assembly protein n=1 Tax=uncultured Gimesia sp. TaxID=1678688 RepID=UPI0030DB13A0|tara:strand:+ start:15326 stop:15895 length:570 start_codon:yes stop_codon:yes gene_type:complete
MEIIRKPSFFRKKTSRLLKPVQDGRRSGSVLLEFILAFPIILIISLAIIEFGFFALLQQTVTAATIEGSREAAQVGATTTSIGNLIQQYVAINSLYLDVAQQPAAPGAGDVLVVIQEGGILPAQTQTIGNSDILCTPVGPPPTPTEVKVTICLNLTDTNGTFPLPNLLSSFGFTLSGKQLEISAMTGLE